MDLNLPTVEVHPTDPIMRAMAIFKDAGIHATLGLAWLLAFNQRSRGRWVSEVKLGHVVKTCRGGHKARIFNLARVSKRKLGRWIRQGRIPKPGTARRKDATP